MTRDEVLALCSTLPGAVEDAPFGDDVAVFRSAAGCSPSSCSAVSRGA
jgi:hypothetical protein